MQKHLGKQQHTFLHIPQILIVNRKIMKSSYCIKRTQLHELNTCIKRMKTKHPADGNAEITHKRTRSPDSFHPNKRQPNHYQSLLSQRMSNDSMETKQYTNNVPLVSNKKRTLDMMVSWENIESIIPKTYVQEDDYTARFREYMSGRYSVLYEFRDFATKLRRKYIELPEWKILGDYIATAQQEIGTVPTDEPYLDDYDSREHTNTRYKPSTGFDVVYYEEGWYQLLQEIDDKINEYITIKCADDNRAAVQNLWNQAKSEFLKVSETNLLV